MAKKDTSRLSSGTMDGVGSSGVPGTYSSNHFSSESVKMIAESIGISSLADSAGKLIADDITQKVKQVVFEAIKFEERSKRRRLLTHDIDHALRTVNVEPVYGFQVDSTEQGLPFRLASGGGRELCFMDSEKEVDLMKLATSTVLPKIPPEVSIKAHWLAIEGVQPAIPENPPPVSKHEQKLESVDPLATSIVGSVVGNPASISSRDNITKKKRLESFKIKQYATHELSVEQQLYYKEITEACVGSDESRRAEALQSLSFDSGLHQMLPRLCTFISEGVKVNVVQNNLALLIYLMRMVKAILENTSLYLEKYLHEICPTIVTCIVSKQLCMRPEFDNHWALRDFAARLLAQTCKTYNTSTNNVQIRLTRVLTKAIDSGVPLSSTYGALSALLELGPDVQRTLVLRRLKMIGDRISSQEGGSGGSGERAKAIEHIQSLVIRVLPALLKTIKQVDNLEEYKQEFGNFFGPKLHVAVTNSRKVGVQLVPPTGQLSHQPSFGSGMITARPVIPGSATITRMTGQQQIGSGNVTYVRVVSTPNQQQRVNIINQNPH